jgi:regulatory protein
LTRFKQRQVSAEQQADPQAAHTAAVALLARRDFAAGELRDKLVANGFSTAVAAATVAELQVEKLLDDARYAEHYVAYRARRGQGPVRIAADLHAVGVDKTLVETALAGVADWNGVAREVRQRKFGSESALSWSEKARQARFLQYRGFAAAHIRAALGSEVDSSEADSPELD